jgi:hypothetical protein
MRICIDDRRQIPFSRGVLSVGLIGAAQRDDQAFDQEYIDLLAARVSKYGLTHPIIVGADGRLLGGGDWLAAVRFLALDTVEAQVVGINLDLWETLPEDLRDQMIGGITAAPTIASALPNLMAPRMTNPHFADQLANAAFHEAGHAVSAFHLGGRLNTAGVTIDGNWYCGAHLPVSAAAAEQIHIPFTLAGDCAEFALIGETEPSASRAQVADALRVIQFRIPFGDLEWAMATLRKNHPLAGDALFELYEMYVNATHDMLQEPNIRRAVESVASKLLTRGHLSSEEVMRIYQRATTRRFKKDLKKRTNWAVRHDR